MQISVDVVALVIASAAALGFLHRKVFKPLYKWASSMVDSLNKINVIYEQMFTNGGSTLRDAVNRIENRITLLEKQQNIYIMDANDGVFQTSKEGKFTYVNRTLCRMVGKSENEILGNGWLNSIAEYDLERVDDAWRYALSNEIEFSQTFDMVNDEGKFFRVKCTANPMKGVENKIIGYLGIIDKYGQA